MSDPVSAIPPKIYRSKDRDSWPILCCPRCKKESQVHMVSVEVVQNTETVEVRRSGIYKSNHRPNGGRGSDVYLQCVCECMLRFTVYFWFYKGNTFVELVNFSEITEEQWPETLWRD